MPAEPSDPAYPTDVAYVRQFCPELNPGLLRAAAAFAGCPPPTADSFDYGELGSGLGDTLVTLAAAYPNARFIGVDVNPEHVASARALAARGGVDNVRFLERDFETLRADDLPALDYLCAHGVLSSIVPSKRRALFAAAAGLLKPGGLLYVGYNALPGWAAVEPLRRFMHDVAASIEGDRETRIRHALAAAKLLCEAGGEYFVANPSAKQILTTMLELGIPYTAHEFFGPHWEPMYFADVAEQAAARDLRFVGQLPLHLNYRDLAVAPALAEAFRPITDRRAWERAKAFANNEFFRRDIYVKGSVRGAENPTRAFLDATPFGTLVSADQVRRDVPLPNRSLRFVGPLFDALIASLAEHASPLADRAREPALAAFGDEALRQATLQLTMGDDVLPMARLSRAPQPSHASQAASRRYRVPSAFNRAILAQPLSSRYEVVLASPIAGTGIRVSALHAVALRSLTEASPEGRSAWLRAYVAANPLRLVDHGRAVVDKATSHGTSAPDSKNSPPGVSRS